MKKTQKMLEIEAKFGEDIESLLRRLYLREKKSQRVIAQILNILEFTVWRYMRNFNIPLRSKTERGKLLWQDEQYKQKVIENRKQIYKNPIYKAKMRRSIKELWQQDDYKQKQKKIPRREISLQLKKQEEYLERYNKGMRKSRRKNKEYLSRALKHRNPNNPEKLILILTPSNVCYTGNGSFWRKLPNGCRANPDFIVKPIRKSRKVIYYHSLYWHREELHDRGKELIDQWKQIGYDCLIIWEDELDDLDSVMEKISDFIGEDTWQLSLPI